MQAHIDISSAGIILISVRLCSVNIMGDKIATQPTQTSWCLLYKTEKNIILILSGIIALPFNLFLIMRLCMKKGLVLLQRLFANPQDCYSITSGMLPEITYILLLKSGCCAKTFEFQPSLEWEYGFGTQAGLVTSDQNKHFFPHPKINFSTKSLFFKILGRIWVSSNSFWNFTRFVKHAV